MRLGSSYQPPKEPPPDVADTHARLPTAAGAVAAAADPAALVRRTVAPAGFVRRRRCPVVPAGPAAPSQQALVPVGPRRRRAGSTGRPGRVAGWTEIGAVAALAAVLASGTTYAVTHGDVTADTADRGPRQPTSQLDPDGARGPGQRRGTRLDRDRGRGSPERRVASPSRPSRAAAQGSGVVIDDKGHILTNNHVVGGAGGQSELTVTLNDGRTYGATSSAPTPPPTSPSSSSTTPRPTSSRSASATPTRSRSATRSWPSATRSASPAPSPPASSAR